MEKKYQVFISSTSKDLVEERQELIRTLLKENYIPIAMEFFPASDSDPLSYIKDIIDECDYFVLIIGGMYGSEFKRKSYTQHEYEYAIKVNKKILSLVHRNINKLPQSRKEKTQSKKDKLKKFKALVEKKLCNYWEQKHELSINALVSLNKLKSQGKQDGWIRATNKNFKNISAIRNKKLIEKEKKLLLKIKNLEQKLSQKENTGNVDFKKVMSMKIRKTDQQINSMFPSKIHSPTRKGNMVFSSQKLINSLGSMGIPANAIWDVLNLAVPELKGLNREVSQLSTTHIRKAISHALYKLSSKEYSEINIQTWGDSYVRKYGNPDRRINVIKNNGDTVPISYHYLKKILIPDIFYEIVGDLNYKSCLHATGTVEISKMAEEILKHLKELNLYNIHYQTLLLLAKDLALQPPHPWISINAFDYESIKYDYERAIDHLNRIKLIGKEQNISIESAKYSLKECLHHSTSGILSMYGVYMGCRYLSPFHNLRHHIKTINSTNTPEVYDYSDFKKIILDLSNINVTIIEFNKLLNNLNNDLNQIINNNFDLLLEDKMKKNIFSLFDIFNKIYQSYYSSDEM